MPRELKAQLENPLNFCVARSASFELGRLGADLCPVLAMILRSLHASSASRVAVSLRKPCDEHCGRPASSQQSRIELPKPAFVNCAPRLLSRNERQVRGIHASARSSSGAIGIGNGVSVLSWRTAIFPVADMLAGPCRIGLRRPVQDAGQRGTNFVDLRRERLSLEWGF